MYLSQAKGKSASVLVFLCHFAGVIPVLAFHWGLWEQRPQYLSYLSYLYWHFIGVFGNKDHWEMSQVLQNGHRNGHEGIKGHGDLHKMSTIPLIR